MAKDIFGIVIWCWYLQKPLTIPHVFCHVAVKKLLNKKKKELLNDKGGKGAAGALHILGHPRVLH